MIAIATSLTAAAQSTPASVQIATAIEDQSSFQAAGVSSGSFLNFHAGKEDTKGSRMLLATWAPGVVLTSGDSLVKSDQLVFNYDKISHDLYYSFDHQTVFEAEQPNIKGFSLTTPDGTLVYVKVDAIRSDVFFREFVHCDSTHYGFYSLTITQFKKADYHSDGLVETGNNYDEYLDLPQYYIIPPGGKIFYPVELSKKSLRSALQESKPKVETFISSHKNDPIDETYVKNLVDALNS
jgi:hypothetical protein